MGIMNYFIGTSQSKYAAIAMFAAIFVICIAILFINTDIPIGFRVGIVLLVLIMTIFPMLISLFQLTCIVTGGKNNTFNPCNIYAWFVTIVIIVYSFMLIVSIIMSIFTYKKALHKVTITENFNKISPEDAEIIAKNILKEEEGESESPSVKSVPELPTIDTFDMPSPSQMLEQTMPSVSSAISSVFKTQQNFENPKQCETPETIKSSGYSEKEKILGYVQNQQVSSSNGNNLDYMELDDNNMGFMELTDVQPTVKDMPVVSVPVKQENKEKFVVPYSDTIEKFSTI